MSGSLRGCSTNSDAEALAAFDRIIGLDLSEVAVDGSLHKAPYGGRRNRPQPL
jgi:putative transposase